MTASMALFLQAVDLMAESKYAEAEAVLQKALVADPDNPDLYEGLARVYDKSNQNQKGLEICAVWREKDPKNNMALSNQSVFFQKLGRIDEAEVAKAEATTLFMKKTMEEQRAKRAL